MIDFLKAKIMADYNQTIPHFAMFKHKKCLKRTIYVILCLEVININMKILGLKVSGYRLLEDGFTLDLRNKARIRTDDYEDEVIDMGCGVDMPASIALVGKNSSGKSTVISLLSYCYTLISTGQFDYHSYDFRKESIDLSIVFMSFETVYLYHVIVKKPLMPEVNPLVSPKCLFSDESLKKRQKDYVFKEDLFEGFEPDELLKEPSGKYVTSLYLFHSIDDDAEGSLFIPSSYSASGKSLDWSAVLMRLSQNLQTDLIAMLDDSIEEIKPVPNTSDFMFKRKGEEEYRITFKDLSYILSDGTKKGLILFSYAIMALRTGWTLLVDEIEGSFHKNLVNNVIYLFNDRKINVNKATLIFTTHYSEVLNSFRRRDSIFVCQRNQDKICIKNVYADFDIRCELSKSKLFDNNAFDTLLNYSSLMKVKNGIADEISGVNRRK